MELTLSWPRRLLVGAFAVLLTFSTAYAAAHSTTTSRVKLRTQPNTTQPNVMTMLDAGTNLTVLGTEGDFTKVQTDTGVVGYVATQFLKPVPGSAAADEAVVAAPAATEAAPPDSTAAVMPDPEPDAAAGTAAVADGAEAAADATAAEAPQAPAEPETAPAAEPPAPAAAAAPEAAGEPTPEGTTRLSAVEVTGSRIKRVDVEGPTPVTTISRQEIDKLGYTTVKDVLANLTVNSGGTFDSGQTFSFARGTQSIDLRGFGAGRTLVLLDGRRLPVFPQGLGGTDAFVDLSTIPASLIERVEILLDGASAIYGSDAIGGVVNIITRKNINEGEASARFSETANGGGGARRFTFANGFTSGDNSVELVAEYSKQNVLAFTDRAYSESDYTHGGLGSAYGSTYQINDADGTFLPDPNCGTPNDALGGLGIPDPASGACRFDRSKFREWIPANESGSLYLRMDHKVSDDITTFGRVGYSRKQQTFHLEPNAYAGGDSEAFTSNRIYPDSAFDQDFGPGYIGDDAPNDKKLGDGLGGFFLRRLVEYGPRGGDMTTEGFTGLIGASGTYDVYNWDVGLGHNEVRVATHQPTILSSVLDNEVSNNGLDLFQPIPADVIARTKHLESEVGVSRDTTIDGTLTGPVGLVLPGGMTQFSVHAEFVKESYSDVFDAITTNGDVFDGGSGGGGARDHYGAGAELNLPIIDSVEFGVAGRYDHYIDPSEVGGAFSPGAKISYRPITSLLLRASASASFRAPDLQRLYGANSAGFADVIDSVLCKASGGTNNHPTTADPHDPCNPISSVPAITGSNTNLKEENGRSYNFGVSWQATTELNTTVDFYRVTVKDIVSSLDPQTVLDACASSGAYCGQIQRATSGPNAGRLGDPVSGGDNTALITAGALNLASQSVSGMDVSASYIYRTENFGRYKTEFNWSHLFSVMVQATADTPNTQELNNNDLVILARDRQSITTDWDLDKYGATIRIDRVGEYAGSQATANAVQQQDFVKAFTTVNVQGRIDLGKKLGMIRVGCDNIFNRDFSIDPTYLPGSPTVQNQYLGENTSFFSNPLGAVYYAQYEIHF